MPIAIETASEPWRPVHPKGVGLSILILASVFSILSVIVVGLRIYVRLAIRCFGTDDWFMCAGTLFGLLHNAAALWGAVSGLGEVDAELTVAQGTEASKAVLVWVIAISLAVPLVKNSICCALMRIAPQRRYRFLLWGLILSTWTMGFVELVSIGVEYRVSNENCTTVAGSCTDYTATTYIGVQFAIWISVDAACTILPVVILWNLQMSTRAKVSTAILFGMGSLATIASIIRLPFTLRSSNTNGRLHHRGEAIAWAIVEVNLGMIGGSMPAIRKLFRWLAEDFSWSPKTPAREQEVGNQYSFVSLRQMMGGRGPIRLRTPDDGTVNGPGDRDLEMSRMSDNLEDQSGQSKGVTAVPNVFTTAPLGHATVITGGHQ